MSVELPQKTQALLNSALANDTLDGGYVRTTASCERHWAVLTDKHQILQVSVFVEQLNEACDLGRRAKVMVGLPDWSGIMRSESEGRLIRKVQEEEATRDDMIVTGKSHTSYCVLEHRN